MNSSDAAESIVRMSMQGLEVAVRISGSGAKNIAVLLYTILKQQQQTKGKTRLVNMLRSNKELKVFSIKQDDIKKFTEESKRYGVLFAALVDKKHKSPDGLVDIMVRAEDASKINRIVERFNLSAFNTANVINDIQKTKESKDKEMKVSLEDKLVDDILSKPIQKEENEQSNPSLAKTEKSPLSEPLSKNKKSLEVGTRVMDKPSVSKELKEIEKEIKSKYSVDSKEKKISNKETKHQQPKEKKKKSKERGI